MPYNATVHEVFIASPSDVQKERDFLVEEIYKWNRENTSHTNIVLMPIRWEDDTYSSISGHEPQDVINEQIKNSADLVIGIFHARLGTPTGNADSGSVQEIREHLAANKPVMVFFSEADVPQPMLRSGFAQVEKIEGFKEELSSQGIHKPYENSEDFKRKIGSELTKITRNHPYFKDENKTESESRPLIDDSKKDKTKSPFFFSWYDLMNPTSIIINDMNLSTKNLLLVAANNGGEIMFLNDFQNTIEVNGQTIASNQDNRGLAEAKNDIKILLKHELIEDQGTSGQIYHVTKQGYDIADELETKD